MADFPLPALPPQFDPSLPFTQVPEVSAPTAPATRPKAATPAAPTAVFDPAQEYTVIPDAPAGPTFDPNATFSKVFSLSDVTTKSEQELADDKDFNPTQFFNDNPDVADSPAELRKLLEAYRVRRERGITGAVVGEALKAAPSVGAKFAKGAFRLASNLYQLTGLQALANQALSGLAGDSPQVQRELLKESGRQAAESGAEIIAGSETAAVGLADLARTGARKVFGKSVKELTEQELLRDLATDAAFQKQLGEVGAGKGEILKAGGLDAESLAKSGIILEPDAIENLSLVDPLTLVATAGVGKGAFTLATAGGKLLATVPTVQAGINLAEKLGTAVKPYIPTTLEGTIGKPIIAAGKAASFVAPAAPAATAVSGAIFHGPFGALAGIAAGKTSRAALTKAGELAQKAGQGIVESKALQALTPIAQRTAAGAAIGTAAAVPIAALAEGDEQAGAILGGGLALGAAFGAGSGVGRVAGELSAKTFFDPHGFKFDPVESPAYGRDALLDTAHQQNLAKRSVNDQGAVTTIREVFRPLNTEVYSVDVGTYAAQLEKFLGRKPTAGELATQGYFDFVDPSGKKVVLLNGDSVNAANHEVSHVLASLLSPETRNQLVSELRKGTPPEQFAAQKAAYEARLGNKVTDLQFLDEQLAENFSAILNNVPVTQLTAPQGFLRALGSVAAQIAEVIGVDATRGRTTPDLNLPLSQRLRAQFDSAARELLEGQQPPQAGQPTAPPQTPPAAPAGPAAPPAAPGSPAARPATPETPPARNIRVTKEQQDALARRAEETGIAEARTLAAKDADPTVSERVNSIANSMEAGNPVLEIEHLGIVSEGTPEAPAGRTARRGEQATGYAELEALRVENRANAPETVVNQHQKTFVPVRFTDQGGTPTLIAMSADKVIANIHRIVKSAADKGAETLIPYENAQGRLTEAGWKQAIADVQAYTENQANGFRGDGQRLTRPTEGELSIPAENREYTPKPLSPEAANFANLIQGLATPETAREIKGKIPGNIKGQILAEAQGRILQDPSVIKPKNVGKQEFKSFPGRRLQEVNPLRNELAARGVDVRQLIEVTERIRAKDIASVKPRTDLNFKAPVTDIIRGGFLPAEGETVQNFADRVNNASPEEFTALVKASATGALTPDAWQLGLNLKNVKDLQVLLDASQKAVEASRTLGKAGDFDAAFAEAGKSQYFREAYEAATDTGSAAIPTGWRRRFPEGKPPFPGGNASEPAFLPRLKKDLSSSEISRLKEGDAEEYFNVGHHTDEDVAQNSSIWAYLDGKIQRDTADKTHGMIWGHDKTDRTFKGRYDAESNTLSFVVPDNLRISTPEEIPNRVLSRLKANFGDDFTLKFFGPEGVQTREGGAFLPRRKTTEPAERELPEYLKFPEQGKISAFSADIVRERGTTPEFWLNSETGKVLLAPDGHIEAARDLGGIPSLADSAEIYDMMAAKGWMRGVNDGGSQNVYLDYSARGVSRLAKQTAEDLSFRVGKEVRYDGETLVKAPTRPGTTKTFNPRTKDIRFLPSEVFSKEEIRNLSNLTRGEFEKQPGIVFHGGRNKYAIRTVPPVSATGNPTGLLGAFFTPEKSEAQRYVKDFHGGKGVVLPAIVRFSKPFLMTFSEFDKIIGPDWTKLGFRAGMEEIRKKAVELKKSLQEQGYDGIIVGSRGKARPQEIIVFDESRFIQPSEDTTPLTAKEKSPGRVELGDIKKRSP